MRNTLSVWTGYSQDGTAIGLAATDIGMGDFAMAALPSAEIEAACAEWDMVATPDTGDGSSDAPTALDSIFMLCLMFALVTPTLTAVTGRTVWIAQYALTAEDGLTAASELIPIIETLDCAALDSLLVAVASLATTIWYFTSGNLAALE